MFGSLQLGEAMVTPGRRAERLSQDQPLPAIRALVEASEAEGRSAPVDAYSMAYVVTEDTGDERKIRDMLSMVQESLGSACGARPTTGSRGRQGGYLILPAAQPGFVRPSVFVTISHGKRKPSL